MTEDETTANKRNQLIRLLVVAAAIVLIGIVVWAATSNKKTSPTTSVTTSESSTADKPTTIPLSGTGQTATDKVKLEAGLATFSMEHTGEGHFSVWLLDDTGAKLELLANDTGNFKGSKAAQIPEVGSYLLDVSADGPWNITIKQ